MSSKFSNLFHKKLFHGKKGVVNLLSWWVELIAFILLVVGFLLSIFFVKSAVVSYIIILLFGMMAGRIIYNRRHGFAFYVIIIGFLMGYILGTRYGDWKLNILFFFLGAALSHYIHTKGYLQNV